MFEEKARLLIQEKYIDLVSEIIETLRELPLKNLQDIIHPPFDTVWEVFVNYVQNDDEALSTLHRDVIIDVCQQAIAPVTLTEIRLLWLGSDGYINWGEKEDFPEIEQMFEDIMGEVWSWIEQEAEEPEFDEDLDEYGELEVFEAYEFEEDDEAEEDKNNKIKPTQH